LTYHPADEEFPTWSSYGRIIAFQTNRHGFAQVWLMRADGSDQSMLIGLIPTAYADFAPVPLG
jgi:Tol biopolymer transport system component